MNAPLSREDLDRFRNAVASQIGLMFDDSKLGFLGDVLLQRLVALKCPADAYLRGLEHKAAAVELAALAGALTVAETYFFRNREQFRALAEIVLPARMRARRSDRSLRLLSAGCASGEEAYTLAIVTREAVAEPGWEIDITAVDLSPQSLAKAHRATYAPWALRETPPEIRRTWFREEGREFILAPAIRASVRFEARNLVGDDPDLWRRGVYDVIFCRNVMMYFSPPQMERLVARLTQALVPGGFLFLGHAETLRGLSEAFHLRHTHETFYYERKGGEPPFPAATPSVPRERPAAGEEWVTAIRAATERVALLVPTPAAAAATPPPVRDLAPALDLMGRERYADALSHVAGLRAETESDPDLLLVEAVLLVHRGNLAAAEAAAQHLLEIDELNTGAHYVLALCAEQRGDLGEAAEHDRIAAYLDPTFAMPRLHLGLLAKRGGNRDAARRELAQAQLLLRREDASRLLLFGGGFGRDGLVALCESASRDQGGAP